VLNGLDDPVDDVPVIDLDPEVDVEETDPVVTDNPGDAEVMELLVNVEIKTVVLLVGRNTPVYVEVDKLDTMQTLVSQHGNVLEVGGWKTTL
jgi:hypothetical protein